MKSESAAARRLPQTAQHKAAMGKPSCSTTSKAGADLWRLIRNDSGSVLAVCPLAEDLAALRRILGRTRWNTREADSCREACTKIVEAPPDVILCDDHLPDGDWTKLLAEVSDSANHPSLIVASRLAEDGMWAEVLNLGAYDLLVKPFEAMEVYRVLGTALQRRRQRRCPAVGA
ncbi:MAG: response regulator [Acidobacteria bacterium]|nr:response regulator [Acidobacteriota bacterium]